MHKIFNIFEKIVEYFILCTLLSFSSSHKSNSGSNFLISFIDFAVVCSEVALS